jgi:hypothetical protein
MGVNLKGVYLMGVYLMGVYLINVHLSATGEDGKVIKRLDSRP